LLLLILDYAVTRREQRPQVTREIPDIWAVDYPGSYTVSVRNTAGRRISGVFDEHSFGYLRKELPPGSFVLDKGQTARFDVRFTPPVRGRISPGPALLRYSSRLGFWLVARRYDLSGEIKIYPHISDYLALDPFLHRQRAYTRGQHAIRMLGEGTEFDSLRDYQPGDDYAKVNWKATARTSRPIVSQYRAERDREIIAVIDGGRLMFAGINGKSRFDRYLDAVAQLSYALRLENDRLGLLLFDRDVRFYRQPTRKPDVLADLFPFYPRHVASDFMRMYAFLSKRHAKRAVVFAFTELTDGITGQRAYTALASLARRHKVVTIILDEPQLYETALAPVASEEQFFLHAAAVSHMKEKKTLCERMRRADVDVIRTYSDKLNADVINKYLELKARNLA
jgi:uncharacterized protein (DUF58 family)